MTDTLLQELNLEATQAEVLAAVTALNAAIAAGVPISADSVAALATALADLHVLVQNWPTDYPDAESAAALDSANTTLAGILTQLEGVTGVSDGDTHSALASILTALGSQGTGLATESTLSAIRSILNGNKDLATSVWTDDSSAYYVRRDVIDTAVGTVTVSFTDQNGTTATPGAGLRPLSSTQRASSPTYYDAISGGTGYSTGDVLAHIVISDPATSPATITGFWINATTTAAISAPTGGTYVAQNKDVTVGASALPAGAATAAKQDTGNTSLASIDGGLGGSSAAAAGNTGASTTNGFLRWLRDWFVATTGQQTSANSLSVTLASDGLFATNFGSKTDTAASTDTGSFSHLALLKRLLTKLPGLGQQTMALSQSVSIASDQTAVQVSDQADVTTTGSLAALNDVVSAAIPAGYKSATIYISGSFSATASFFISNDGGASYPYSITGITINESSTSGATSTATQTNGFEFALPAGATHIQAKATVFSSGPVSVSISVSRRQARPLSTSTAATASTNRTSMGVAASKWTQQSVTNLAAGATFTGSWQDMFNAASGAVGGSSSYPAKYVPFGTCDKTCSLYVDQSPDASTAYQSDTFVGAIPTDGANYVAKPPVGTAILPATRWCRSRLKNTSGSTSTVLFLTDAQVGQ